MALKLKAAILCFMFLPLNGFANIEYDSAWHLKDWEKKRLEEGRVITHASSHEGYARQLKAYLLIHTPAEQIFSIITDHEKTPEFMPNLDRVQIVAASEEAVLANYMLTLPFGVKKRYRLKLVEDTGPDALQLSWNLVPWAELKPEETIAATSGSWLLKATGNNELTLLVYDTTTDPGDVPFGLGWIVDYLTNQTVIELLEKTKERAERQWMESKKKLN